jgi:hypothetical protein
MVINTIWRSENGKNKLKTDISVPTRTVTKTIKEKQPIVYVNTPLDWWQKKGWIFVFVALAFVLGYILRRVDSKISL